MDIMNQIKNNLDNNNYLSDSIRNQIFELINIFHKTFPEINLDRLNEKIGTVKIGKISLYERKGPVVYDIKNNEIFFSKKSLEDDYDVNHLMMKGLIAIISISITNDYYGYNKNNSLYALTLGFTEMLANTLVGNEGKCDFEEELLATNLVSQIIGKDIMFNAFFNNDAETIFKKMLEAEVG